MTHRNIQASLLLDLFSLKVIVGFVYLMGIEENWGKSIENQPHALIRHLRHFVFIHAFISLHWEIKLAETTSQ